MWGYGDGNGNEGSSGCGLAWHDGEGRISNNECSEIAANMFKNCTEGPPNV